LSVSVIALLGAGARYLLSGNDRKDILRRVDYSVLAFFLQCLLATSNYPSVAFVPLNRRRRTIAGSWHLLQCWLEQHQSLWHCLQFGLENVPTIKLYV
jgi:hypothetical protein